MFERTRETFKLKPNERCPGEVFCTENPLGEIARQASATLETHCNKERCKLFFTNSKSTPTELAGAFEAACVLRARHKNGLALREDEFPFWAIQAYETAERVYEVVDAESYEDKDAENERGFDILKGGDSDAYANIERWLAQKRQ